MSICGMPTEPAEGVLWDVPELVLTAEGAVAYVDRNGELFDRRV